MGLRSLSFKFFRRNQDFQTQTQKPNFEENYTPEMYERESKYRPYRLFGTAAAGGAAVFSVAAVCSERWMFARGK